MNPGASARAGRLPAVILGIDTPIGLAIIRDLGARGVAVHGVTRDAAALGLASRYLTKGHRRAADTDGLLVQLQTLGRALGHACLFAVAESDIALLNRYRHRLADYTFMFADARRMRQVLDKQCTYAAARAVGLTVPRTEQVASLAQAAALCDSLRYPVVLKWRDPNGVLPLLAAAGLALDKAHYCHDSAQLLAYLARYAPLGRYPLIQEYCSGYGLGQFVLMAGGCAHFLFQHRRVHEWPPEGGISSLSEALPLAQHAGLMAQSVALLRALDWEGVAMVEYRHDEASGVSSLMEVNGRFWGSLPLACQAGAGFPWLLYRLLGQGSPVSQTRYRSGLRCRFMIPETKRLFRLLFGRRLLVSSALAAPEDPGVRPAALRYATPSVCRSASRATRNGFGRRAAIAAYLIGFLYRPTCYQIFCWSDPMPFWRDTLHTVRKLLRLT